MEAFTYRGARSASLTFGLCGVLLVEGLVLHLWLATRHPWLAWLLTLATASALLWLALDYHALGRGAVVVADDTIDFVVGRRAWVRVPRASIAAATRPGWRDIPTRGTVEAAGFVDLTRPAEPNVLLTLAHPVTVRVAGGLRRIATRLALHVDDPDAFLARLSSDG